METFIDGVTVLSETEICQTPIVIVVACLTISCIVIILTGIFTRENPLAGFGITIILCLMSAAICSAKREPTGEYEYKVTIDDRVSMNDFYEHYEIKSQEGKIYTIELKDVE